MTNSKLSLIAVAVALALTAPIARGASPTFDARIRPFTLIAAQRADLAHQLRAWRGIMIKLPPARCVDYDTDCILLKPKGCHWVSAATADCRFDALGVFFSLDGVPVLSTLRMWDGVERRSGHWRVWVRS